MVEDPLRLWLGSVLVAAVAVAGRAPTGEVVSVSISPSPAIANVARIEATAVVVGGETQSETFNFGSRSTPIVFAIAFPSHYVGKMVSVSAHLFDAASKVLGTVQGAITIGKGTTPLVLGAPCLGVRSRMVDAVCAHGGCRVACVAVARFQGSGAGSVWCAACGQCALVVVVFRLASGRAGRSGGLRPTGAHRGHGSGLLAYRSLGCAAIGAIPLVGELCFGAHVGGMAEQPQSSVMRAFGSRC